MLAPAEAERLILENTRILDPEGCPIAQAHGRVLRKEVRADRDLPPFDRVTMDGYAICAASLAAGVRAFRVEAVQAAGMRPATLGPGADGCVEIMTGAMLPAGADCVVPYENTRRDGPLVRIEGETAAFAAGHAIHYRGSDHHAGESIVAAGTRLTGREIAVAAACGYPSVTVSRLPTIGVVTTGDELVEVGSIVAPYQIRRSNDYAIRAALAAAGYPRVERFHLRDMRHEIEHMLWHIVAEYDVVLVTGGISKGKFDYLPAELDRQGVRKIFQGVAQRPGKPFWFGLTSRKTPVFALPGNPVSAFTCLHRYVLPALERASGLAPVPRRSVALASTVEVPAGLAYLLPVKLASGPKAEQLATPMPANTSGDYAGLVGTDGFVELSAGGRFPAGHIAPFWPWT